MNKLKYDGQKESDPKRIGSLEHAFASCIRVVTWEIPAVTIKSSKTESIKGVY